MPSFFTEFVLKDPWYILRLAILIDDPPFAMEPIGQAARETLILSMAKAALAIYLRTRWPCAAF